MGVEGRRVRAARPGQTSRSRTEDGSATNERPDPHRRYAGIDRGHAPSPGPKAVFYLLHTLSVGVCVWLVGFGGLASVGEWIGRPVDGIEQARASLMLGAVVLYRARHGLTLFSLLQRRVEWGEAMGLGSVIVLLEVGLVLLACGVTRAEPAPPGWLDGLAVALVVIGSWLNSGSELQRQAWKRRPANRGHL